jgi:hypothetical protein
MELIESKIRIKFCECEHAQSYVYTLRLVQEKWDFGEDLFRCFMWFMLRFGYCWSAVWLGFSFFCHSLAFSGLPQAS